MLKGTGEPLALVGESPTPPIVFRVLNPNLIIE